MHANGACRVGWVAEVGGAPEAVALHTADVKGEREDLFIGSEQHIDNDWATRIAVAALRVGETHNIIACKRVIVWGCIELL